MLCTNLSTRPFYNVRAVQVVLVAVALLVLLVTAYNIVEVVRLSIAQRTLGARAAEAEAEAARLRDDAARIRAQIDPEELASVSGAAAEANGIIDQRAFSWTGLLMHFEQALPADVRITAVRPRQERDGRTVISMGVHARRVEDLDAFIEALEMTGAFRRVLPLESQTDEDGLIEAVVEGTYIQPPRVEPVRQAGGRP